MEMCEHKELYDDRCTECGIVFVQIPASQWAAVTGLPEKWRLWARPIGTTPEPTGAAVANACARELAALLKEADDGND